MSRRVCFFLPAYSACEKLPCRCIAPSLGPPDRRILPERTRQQPDIFRCFLNYIGETAEARRRAEEALRLSPFDPHIFFTHCTLAITAYIEGDYKLAVTWARRSYAENPTYTANLRFLAASLAANGQLKDARGVGESLCRPDPHFQVRNFLQTYAVQNEQLKARLGEHLLAAGLPP